MPLFYTFDAFTEQYQTMMNKLKCLTLAAILGFSSLSGMASTPDEGMWLPMLINKNYDEMKRLGFKLTADDVYQVNNSSLKDAIVSLGFCTGEMISAEGLMLTNHHCGYGSIQYHSSVEHDYLTDGFWAKTREEELYSPEMVASFLVRMEDVTVKILKETNGLPDAEKDAKMREVTKTLTAEATKGTHYTAIVRDVFGGNQYLLFVYERFPDVRMVGAPPSSIGKFGGDTDNWMWPRHTGDFSLFRVYMGKDGKPAPYSKDNVPYKPKKHLPISIKGVSKGDFSMVMGYPGRTNRYAFSRELQNSVEKVNPAIVALFGKRLEVMKADMDKDASVRIKLADGYASIANTWKYYIGQNEGLLKLDVISGKQELERKFVKFANSTPSLKAKYGEVFTNVDKLYDDYKPYILRNTYLNVTTSTNGLYQYAALSKGLADALKKNDKDAIAAEVKKLQDGMEERFKDYTPETDQKVLAALMTLYYNDIPKDQRLPLLDEIQKKYKAKTPEESFRKFTADMYKRSIWASQERLNAFLAVPDLKKLEADPAYQFYVKAGDFRKTYIDHVNSFSAAIAVQKKAYIAGLMEMFPNREMYPDANSTMRVSYGKISDYSPKDGVEFSYYTTTRGILEKFDPNNEEFVVPQRLIDLIKEKDFGQYADAKGELVVAFLSDNDITGGNSGSPVINGNGELIGCAFDGNWEAMTGDLVFDKNYKKTISVDIRYVLFIIDKYAGATHLINEMTLVK